MNSKTINQGKILAFVSYLPIFGIIIAYFLNNDKKNSFTSFHIRQSLGLWLFYFICAVSLSNFDSALLRSYLWIGFGILFLYGLLTALVGSHFPVPILGPLFQKWFKNI